MGLDAGLQSCHLVIKMAIKSAQIVKIGAAVFGCTQTSAFTNLHNFWPWISTQSKKILFFIATFLVWPSFVIEMIEAEIQERKGAWRSTRRIYGSSTEWHGGIQVNWLFVAEWFISLGFNHFESTACIILAQEALLVAWKRAGPSGQLLKVKFNDRMKAFVQFLNSQTRSSNPHSASHLKNPLQCWEESVAPVLLYSEKESCWTLETRAIPSTADSRFSRP